MDDLRMIAPRVPRIEAFAALAGLEAAVRGILISVMPLAMYEALGSAAAVSRSRLDALGASMQELFDQLIHADGATATKPPRGPRRRAAASA